MYPECRHIMPSGARCHSPALRGKPYCFFHSRLHKLNGPAASAAKEAEVKIEMLEDPAAVQLALTRVLASLASSSIDPRRAGLLLYGLQTAAHMASRHERFADSEAVQDICIAEDGQPIAEEKDACEPPEDCKRCPRRKTCPDRKLLDIVQNRGAE